MTDNIWTREEKLEAAENDDLSPQALTRFAKEFMSRIHVEAFFHGNLTPKKALELLDVIENRIGKDNLPIPNVALLRPRTLELQPSGIYYYFDLTKKKYVQYFDFTEILFRNILISRKKNIFFNLTIFFQKPIILK